MDSGFTKPDIDAIRQLLRTMVGKRVVVVGDVMLDAYLTGRIARISPEAPVPVFNIEREETMLGGAANVGKCLVALGAEVVLCGVVGDDANAGLLREETTNTGIRETGLVTDPARATTLKTRVVAQRQQMMRLDRESPAPLSPTVEDALVERVRTAIRGRSESEHAPGEASSSPADAVVLSDYSKGTLTEAVCQAAIEAANQVHTDRAIPVIVDPKDLPWARYRGATVIKPNAREAGWFHGHAVEDDASAAAAARTMLDQLEVRHALITRSEQGMTLASTPASPTLPPRSAPSAASRSSHHGAPASSCDSPPLAVLHLPPLRREVYDPTGAGDIVATVLALALAGGGDGPTAAWLANIAAAVEVSKFGTAVVADSEILDALDVHRGDAAFERKVLTRDAAARFAADLRAQGKRVVFTNGCFDILHIGHVNYLAQSARRGDALIVGVNTDASVRRLKGPGRPIQSEQDRAHILASQACVDAVVLFDEPTPLALIQAIRPAVLTKGGDYHDKQQVVGWEVVEKDGGRVELIDLTEGRSTTKLIEKATR